MKSQFFLVRSDASDSEPDPQPTPIAIRLVKDKKPAPEFPPIPDLTKKDDRFYPAWDRFLALEPRRGKKLSSVARGIAEEQDALQVHPEGIEIRERAATSYEEAAEVCRQKVAAIVEECERLNQKYRVATFDLEASADCLRSLSGRFVDALGSLGAPPWVKRVSDLYDRPQFFVDGADAADVHQGCGGDCWFLAALMSICAKPDLVNKLCVARNETAGVYGFVFFRDGEWISEVVDDKLYIKVADDDVLDIVKDWNREKKYGIGLRFDEDKLRAQLQKGSEALYFSSGSENETWVPLIEKAYAKAHGDYCAIEGGFASEGAEDLTGGVATVIQCEDIMDKDRFWNDYLMKVNDQYLFGAGGLPSDKKGLISSHAYAILQAYENKDKGLRLCKLKNPWADNREWTGDWSDGSKMWTGEMLQAVGHSFGDDGLFWLSYEELLKHFPALNRVRLFDESWALAGCWTTVAVPWTVDYLDDSFKFSTTEAGPVVIVLQQPDDRYFKGLKGRYYHSLHFRVYKEGREEKYIVRSLHNSGNFRHDTRSVSAEIDHLEPGTYEVLFKITTQRIDDDVTVSEIVKNSAKARKDKLLEVGRRFDFAATKGNLRKAEQELCNASRSRKFDQKRDDMKRARVKAQKVRAQEKKKRERIKKAKKERRDAKKRNDGVKEKDGEEKASTAKSNTDAAIVVGFSEGPPREGPTLTEDASSKKCEGEHSQSQGNIEIVKAPRPAEEETDSKPETVEGEKNLEVDKGPESAADKEAKVESGEDSKQRVKEDMKDTDQDEEKEDMQKEVSHPDHEHCEDDSEDELIISDTDFDWDSDIDDPTYLTSDEENDKNDTDMFGSDPWSALCVVGLRVYAQGTPPKVWVVKGAVS